MLRLCSIKRLVLLSAARKLKRSMCSTGGARPILEVKKKKRYSELTAQELEAEIEQNLALLAKSFEKDESENYVVPIFKKSILHAARTAIKDSNGEYTYIQMYVSAKRLAFQISNVCGSASMKNVAYLCPNNVLTPLTQWACWISGQVAMPLNTCSSPELHKALLKDAKARLLIASVDNESIAAQLAEALAIPTIIIDHSFMAPPETNLISMPRLLIPSIETVLVEGTFTNDFYTNANAMLLYTKGTTGKPKGVVLTHRNIDAQIRSLRDAWKYNENDSLLHALPQKWAHGFLNAYLTPLSVGGRIVMHDRFDVKNIWADLLGVNTTAKDRINCFIAIPSVFNLLIEEYERTFKKRNMKEYIASYCTENIRLMGSGGAPLPAMTFRRWQSISEHRILEFYCSTEFGVALSHPYVQSCSSSTSSSSSSSSSGGVKQDQFEQRESGFVGLPLPDVRVRLVDSKGKILIDCIGEYNSTNDDQQWNARYLEIETQPPKTSYSETRTFKFFYDIKTTFKDIFSIAIRIFEKLHYFLKLQIKSKKIHPDGTSQQQQQQLLLQNNDNALLQKGILVGELEISGPQIFKNYFNSSGVENDDSKNAMNGEFFKTGDLAIFQLDAFRILGRCNIDVIEFDGQKISSYDIESLLLEHPNVRDVSVVAIPQDVGISETDEESSSSSSCKKPIKLTKTFGVICALQHGTQLDLNSLNIFCSKSLPKCFLPTKLKIVDEMPHFTMPEINRQALVDLFHQNEKIKPS